jgi:hypothetical protein
MSRGPGKIETRIADLFAATRDHALSIDAITDHAFALAGKTPTRAQRLSATRAAHRMLRRVLDDDERAAKLISQARANTKAALGRDRSGYPDEAYDTKLEADPAFIEGDRLHDACRRIGTWMRLYER